MDLFLIRHGECGTADGNWSPDPPLTEVGRLQATALGRAMARLAVTAVIISPLRRALETARLAVENLEPQPSLTVWTELREGLDDPHRLPGRTALAGEFPDFCFPDDLGQDEWVHGGDRIEEFVARARAVLSRLSAQFSGEERVAVVAHGGIGNYLLRSAMAVTSDAEVFIELSEASISHIRLHSGHARGRWGLLYPAPAVEILSVNDVAHLRRTD